MERKEREAANPKKGTRHTQSTGEKEYSIRLNYSTHLKSRNLWEELETTIRNSDGTVAVKKCKKWVQEGKNKTITGRNKPEPSGGKHKKIAFDLRGAGKENNQKE